MYNCRLLFFFKLLIISNITYSQSLIARYESLPVNTVANTPKDEEIFKNLGIKLTNKPRITFLMYSNGESKYYSKNDTLSGIVVTNSDVGSIYKNQNSKTILLRVNINNEKYLVSELMSPLKWQLLEEFKNVGLYKCKKAIFKRGDGALITAWYSEDIPINDGPQTYWGLPGLILELHNSRNTLTVTCTSLKYDPKGAQNIEAPTNGKLINENQFRKEMEIWGTKQADGSYVIQN